MGGAGLGLQYREWNGRPNAGRPSVRASDSSQHLIQSMICRYCGKKIDENRLAHLPALPVCDECGSLQATELAFPEVSTIDRGVKAPNIPPRFQVLGQAGEGSFGVVSRCFDTLLKREVALKVPQPGSIQADLFLREARSASNLKHESIVRIHDVGEHNGRPYIVSEFVQGKTLRSWLNETSHSRDEILRLVIRIAKAIQYAHDQGVIHRDLKPGNIMVDQLGNPMVLDFGLSRSLYSEDDTLMQAGRPIGTPAFMAPEQVRGQKSQIGTWSDVYSLGVILFQVLVRQLPYSGTVTEVYSRIVGSDPPPRLRNRDRTIPPPLEAICMKAMAKAPEDRYLSAIEFAEDLENFLNGKPMVAYRRIHRRRFMALAHRNWLPAVAAVLAAAALLSGWLVYQDYRRNNPEIPVVMSSNPAGAELVWYRFDPELGVIDPQSQIQSVAGEVVRLSPGFYQVWARLDGEVFDVFRSVPQSMAAAENMVYRRIGAEQVTIDHRSSTVVNGIVVVPELKLVPGSRVSGPLAFQAGGVITSLDQPDILVAFSGIRRKLAPFLIDTHEVTWREITAVWHDFPVPEGSLTDDPAVGLPWDLAVAWAEDNGKSLPTVCEMAFAATNGGTSKFPWGDQMTESQKSLPPDALKPASFDQNRANPAVTGLLTGCHEWCADPFAPVRRVDGKLVHDATHDVSTGGVRSPGLYLNSAWYVCLALPPEKIGVPAVFSSIASIPETHNFSNLGFRTVRRLNLPNFP